MSKQKSRNAIRRALRETGKFPQEYEPKQAEKYFNARINKPAVTVEKLPSGMYVFTYKNGQRLFARGPLVTHIMEGIPYTEIEVTK